MKASRTIRHWRIVEAVIERNFLQPLAQDGILSQRSPSHLDLLRSLHEAGSDVGDGLADLASSEIAGELAGHESALYSPLVAKRRAFVGK